MRQMAKALDDVEMDETVRGALHDFFQRSSAYVVNHGKAPAHDGNCSHPEMAARWDGQRRIDEAVAAIRSRDFARALAIADACEGAGLAGLMALMIGSGEDVLLACVHGKLKQNPILAQNRYAGRTLLHNARDVKSVELLLRLGADPNAVDGGKHAPLYSLANERRTGGGDVVRALVRGGAEVDACGGVKRCTALHMAARRGNVEIAEALLACGADIGARDSQGVMPWQRAVNCRQPAVAALLKR